MGTSLRQSFRRLCLRLFLAVSLSLVWCFCASEANALPPEWQASFARELRQGADAHYPYVWGASDPDEFTYDTKAKRWKKGLDCSGFIFWAARRSALPGVSRISAADMARGLGGFTGYDLPHKLLDANEEGDLLFWTWRGQVRIGHVGAVLTGPSSSPSEDRILGVVDAGSKGTGWRPLFNADQVTKVRRLTIGDKK